MIKICLPYYPFSIWLGIRNSKESKNLLFMATPHYWLRLIHRLATTMHSPNSFQM